MKWKMLIGFGQRNECLNSLYIDNEHNIMKYYFFTFLFLIPVCSIGQNQALSIFDNIVDKTWKAEGNWGNGSPFYQEIDARYGLNKSVVIVESIGFVDEAQTKLGLRNQGIRQYDAKCECLRFWEFDVFGGLTEGVVFQEGKNIVYQYDYGGSKVTDMWEYVDNNTYNFKVGAYKDGKWEQVYLNTQFKSVNPSEKDMNYEAIKERLKGNWSSPAWSGQLDETWSVDPNSHIVQTASYSEEGVVSYSASNKIEIVGEEWVLFTVIKDSNPKIFKATSVTKDKIVFENSDYANPNKVVYEFTSPDTFKRTISGLENGEPSSYTFTFTRVQ